MRNRRLRDVQWIAGLTLVTAMGGCRAPQTSSAPAATQVSPMQGDTVANQRAAGRPRRPRPDKAAQPGAFDFYLLTLSWSPEYCLTHSGAVECSAHPDFVLHGLWPENTNGSYPEDCSDAPGPSDPGAYKDIYPDQGLLEHEWSTHGTCSGLSADAFFQAARQANASIHIPAVLAGKITPDQETPAQILSSFAQANPGDPAGSFLLSCGNNRLTAIQVCLGKNLQAMSCPALRSCRANVVKITAP